MLYRYKYDISIVMGYYNRKSQIINTLDYFQLNYSNYNYEVIIVDDNSILEHQLDEVITKYTFPIKYIKISEEEKGDRINPCTTYNIGFKEAGGERVIIQNPECIHRGDILGYVKNNLTSDDYVAFSCYNCYTDELTQQLLKDPSLINNKHFNLSNRFHWYNHPTIRPVHYHFCAAIMNDNLKILGGFNEEFAKGHSYDDNEILLSIKKNLKLNIKTIQPNECGYVIHQWHESVAQNTLTKTVFDGMLKHNYNLYHKMLQEHTKYDFNFPKLLHLYWDGSPFSYLNLLTVLSFNKHHIGWKINVFCPIKRNDKISWITNEQKITYTGPDFFSELKQINNVNIHHIDTDLLQFEHKDASEVIKSDYFRLYVLNQFGGIWSDFDIIYTNNVERYYANKKLNKCKNVIIFRYKSKEVIKFRYKSKEVIKYVYPVGLFIANKNNSLIDSILKSINIFYNPLNYQCLGTTMFETIFEKYKSNPLLTDIVSNMSLKEMYVDNSDCYHKVKWNQLDTLYKNKHIDLYKIESDNNIFGIHWFNGADISKKYVNQLDLKLLKHNEPTCLMDKIVKKYI